MFPAFPSHQQFSISYGMVMLCPGELDPGEWGCDTPWRKVPEDVPRKGAGAEGVELTPCLMKPKYFPLGKSKGQDTDVVSLPSLPSVKIWIFIPGSSSS